MKLILLEVIAPGAYGIDLPDSMKYKTIEMFLDKRRERSLGLSIRIERRAVPTIIESHK